MKSPWRLGEHFIEMADLLEMDTDLGESLHIIASGLPGAEWNFLRKLQREVEAGRPLSDSLADQLPSLPGFCVEILHQAERERELPAALRDLGAYMVEMNRVSSSNREIRRQFFYPALVLLVAVLISGVLLVFVVPRFKELFISFGADLPALTLALINLSDLAANYWWVALVLVPMFAFLWRWLAGYVRLFRRVPGLLLLHTPYLGRLYAMTASAQISRTLGFCLSLGKPLGQAWEAASEAVGEGYAREVVGDVLERMADGASLVDAIDRERLFPPKLRTTLIIGEKKRQLDRLLLHTATQYADEATAVSGAGSILEPLGMIIVGVLVGVFVIAMYLPIFKMAAVV